MCGSRVCVGVWRGSADSGEPVFDYVSYWLYSLGVTPIILTFVYFKRGGEISIRVGEEYSCLQME